MTDQHIELKGEVVEVAKGGFRIKLHSNGQVIFARLGGKLRKNKIRILLQDVVTVKLSVYDLTHGILIYRH